MLMVILLTTCVAQPCQLAAMCQFAWMLNHSNNAMSPCAQHRGYIPVHACGGALMTFMTRV